MSQLEADMETVIAGMVKSFGDQLQREHDDRVAAHERLANAYFQEHSQLGQRVAALRQECESDSRNVWDLLKEHDRLIDRVRPCMRETFWGRLRWFLTGE